MTPTDPTIEWTVGLPMDQETSKALREPFAPGQVGKLPKRTCGKCSKAPGKVCSDHQKRKCDHCGNYMTTAHIDLDYVGHAQVTARLLDVDPAWTWEPVAFDVDGLPAIVVEQSGRRVMWIKLTVLGVTRLGVGIVDSEKGEVEKELISDALRNAAMRFGVALDLWAKGDLNADDHEPPAPSARKPAEPDIDWQALGWDSQEHHDTEWEHCKVRTRSLTDGQQSDVKAWIAAEGQTPPYPVAFLTEWADMIDTLAGVTPDEAPKRPVEDTADPTLLGDDDTGRPFE